MDNPLCRAQRHHESAHITMLYSLSTAGLYIRCYRCNRHVPKPKRRGQLWDWLQLGRLFR